VPGLRLDLSEDGFSTGLVSRDDHDRGPHIGQVDGRNLPDTPAASGDEADFASHYLVVHVSSLHGGHIGTSVLQFASREPRTSKDLMGDPCPEACGCGGRRRCLDGSNLWFIVVDQPFKPYTGWRFPYVS